MDGTQLVVEVKEITVGFWVCQEAKVLVICSTLVSDPALEGEIALTLKVVLEVINCLQVRIVVPPGTVGVVRNIRKVDVKRI